MNENRLFEYQNIGLPEDILRRKMAGDYKGALRLIGQRLKEDLPDSLRCSLKLQEEMIRRLPEEFPYNRYEALSLVRAYIPDFTEEEFDRLVDERRIRWMYLDGKERYFNRFLSSLVTAYPGFEERMQTEPEEEFRIDGLHIRDYSRKVMEEKGAMANRIRIRASVKVKEECFVPGMFIRAHLPIPSACIQQRDIRIEKVYPEHGMVAPEDALQRTVCWEEYMTENHEFTVEYSYIHEAKYEPVYGKTGIPGAYDFCLEEQEPHIVFTSYIRALVKELTEGITDPLQKAQAFYDYITKNMKYTYMPSYFLLERIPETCALTCTGDCGVFALLFITLCRCAGIPAQWQSGLAVEPTSCGGHDWARFYVEPYGWRFVDVSFGVSANAAGLEERRKFYFGNMDPFRMVANEAYQKPFTVPKSFFRCDPYDNQLGEMETEDRGLTYNEYERRKEVLLCETE